MPFEPDIIVTGPDGSDIVLVVEAKTHLFALEETERKLKEFMAAVNSPIGMLVSPERLLLYRDQYLSTPEESIRRVGDFDVRAILQFEPTGNQQRDPFAFERHVQTWLEGLSSEPGVRELPPDLRRAVKMYIEPAVAQGEVRSGHPRPAVTA
jgi:hypothetical protein